MPRSAIFSKPRFFRDFLAGPRILVFTRLKIVGKRSSRNFLNAARATGIDLLDFQFAPNPGEPAQPLKAIASSGEMARVMLALKTVLAAQDEVPVLVFDEVDANVGGETAKVVGQKMAQIAKKRQVLCITHLAPVAASASAHYLVKKHVTNGRTLSEVDLLGGEV